MQQSFTCVFPVRPVRALYSWSMSQGLQFQGPDFGKHWLTANSQDGLNGPFFSNMPKHRPFIGRYSSGCRTKCSLKCFSFSFFSCLPKILLKKPFLILSAGWWCSTAVFGRQWDERDELRGWGRALQWPMCVF